MRWLDGNRQLLRLVLLIVGAATGEAEAQTGGSTAQVKVVVEFRQQGVQHREGAQGGGVIVVPRSGTVRGRGGVGVEDTTTRTTRSTGLFVVASDGAVGTILVARDVPVSHVSFFYDQAVGGGYVVAGTAWQRVGAGLAVRPVLLPERLIRVRLAPWLSYLTAAGGGTVEMTQAATELVVRSGQRIHLGGTATDLHAVTRRILGYRSESESTEQAIFLTATIQ